MQQPLWIIDVFGATDSGDEGANNDVFQEIIRKISKKHYGDKNQWWYYTKIGVEQHSLAPHEFLIWLTAEGQKFIAAIDEANRNAGNAFIHVACYNILIIGSALNQPALKKFHLLPGFIAGCHRKFLPIGLERGLNIKGLLYLPSNILRTHNSQVNEISLFLSSLETIIRSNNNSFDELIIVQNEQCVNERDESYTFLDAHQIELLLSQIVANIYFCTETAIFTSVRQHHDNVRCFSVGATAIHYDSQQHIDILAKQLGENVLERFVFSVEEPFYSNEHAEILAGRVTENMNMSTVSGLFTAKTGGIKTETEQFEPLKKLHPVKNFYNYHLRNRHFGNYLKYLPARLHEYTRTFMSRLYGKFQTGLNEAYNDLLSGYKGQMNDVSALILNPGSTANGLQQYRRVLGLIRQRLTEIRNRSVNRAANSGIFTIPENLQDGYQKFEKVNFGKESRDIEQRIKSLLENQAPFAGTIARSLILSIGLIFTIIPLLHYVHPDIMNLGILGTWDWLTGLLLLVIPIFVIWCFGIRRNLKKIRKNIYNYIGLHLRKTEIAAEKVLNRKVSDFYNDLIDYIIQLEQKAEELQSLTYPDTEPPFLPENMFIQPLIGGNFGNHNILTDHTLVTYPVKVTDARSALLPNLSSDDYFLIISGIFQNQELRSSLFAEQLNMNDIGQLLQSECRRCIITDREQTLGDWLRATSEAVNLKGMVAFSVPSADVCHGIRHEIFTEMKCDREFRSENFIQIAGTAGISLLLQEQNAEFILFMTRMRAMGSVFDLVHPSDISAETIRNLIFSDEEYLDALFLTDIFTGHDRKFRLYMVSENIFESGLPDHSNDKYNVLSQLFTNP